MMKKIIVSKVELRKILLKLLGKKRTALIYLVVWLYFSMVRLMAACAAEVIASASSRMTIFIWPTEPPKDEGPIERCENSLIWKKRTNP